MPEMPDDYLVTVLRPFVRATRPVLDGLRESDPFGLRARVAPGAGRPAPDGSADGPTPEERSLADKILDTLASVQVPGTAAWARMGVEARAHWWVYRVGRFTTLIAAIPGLGGALARTLPVSDAVGAAGEGLLLVAIAGEHGVRDEDRLVELLASVLFRRELTLDQRALTAEEDAAVDTRASELTGDLAGFGTRATLKRVGAAVWRLGRALWSVEDELDKRPNGRFYHQWIGLLPVVGVVGKYLGEWSGLKRAARHGHTWLERRGLAARG
ncbi:MULTISPECIES: hypothetical protein [unclassified Pseudonocardia]|uniref:hypothetical protein n=1 Tax=Pseudonocardia sp. P1 TaxID=761194 RepID=UPI0001FFE184|nr:hypothetical protein [Pseudonocardia sp. Ae707_Ps1]OLM16543.1 hypothetical protein Ae707Ps1_0801 [Pseudonocardia sp. Ae707_Ps1]